ncbi:MAG: hypothetical protein VX307_02105 [Chloroflexota bacterium]|nr:hypothetical protein [Chloroflexota bacterium]
MRREYSGPGINQPPLTIKITPDAVKDVTRTPVADDSTPTTIEPTELVTSDVSPTGPPAQSTSGPSMVETIAPIESVKVAVSDASPLVYTLRITSVIPVGCVKFAGTRLSKRAGPSTSP